MMVNSRLEGLYNQVELIQGIGDRQHAQLCIMSFVALVVGEDHSDDPGTVSRVIRWYAIAINDQMPPSLWQDPKCFAPQMIGTRDGHDAIRAKLLLDTAQTDLPPRIEADIGGFGSAILAHGKKQTFRAWLHAYHWVKTHVAQSIKLLDEGVREDAASMVACLICGCARIIPLAGRRAWYWAKAVDLLDRVCIIGLEVARPTVSEDHLDFLSRFLASRPQPPAQSAYATSLWVSVCKLLPALT